ncbi:hypothetical protein OHC33_008999 [Knufia fluminis]|uniref:DUF803-domain-containing protein n=1 Tax=Knufia fluminis TaxID=191047 RepID=A0AAN8EQL8_9EURO|nr:hypothetical protein OHC33_008999 [Knufia fluminis]
MPALPNPYTSYGGSNGSQPRQWSSIVGIVTAIIGNVLISFALNTQRYAHIRIDREYKDKQDPEAKQARKHLPKNLRNYGSAVQQEEAAEERQRINETAEVPEELNGHHSEDEESRPNGKRHASDDTVRPDQEEGGEEEDHGRKSYLKSPWWWLGIVLMTIGETGNFLAYGFAPASIVSPLGVVALISNCMIAPLMLKERFRQRDLWGVLIAIGGAVTVVLSAKTQEKKLGPSGLWADIKRWEFLVYVLITCGFIVALMFASPKYGQRTIMVDLGLVGLFGGYTALSTKGVASLLSTSLYRAFEYPILYVLVLVLVVSAVMQIRYLNRALQNFNSTQVIPVQFVLFTLSVIIGSAVLYRDFERTDVDHVLKFIFGCLLTFGGVYLITSGRKQEDEEEDEAIKDHDAERIHLLDEEQVDQPTSPTKQELDLKLDTTKLEPLAPQTPLQPSSRASSAVPSIAVTPAASTDDLNKNPWLSSTDHLSQLKDTASSARPQTPRNQTIPSASASQTTFFTPRTSAQERLTRTLSSPAQPETPTRRAASPPKPSLADTARRGSIARLLPGPILQPLSSSLSGIAADHILRGEGTPSSNRMSLRRHRSNREATRLRAAAAGISDTEIESGPVSAFASEASVQRARDARRAQAAVGGEDSPLLRRTRTGEDPGQGLSGSLKKTKGRLRGMSETLTSIMTGRRGSRDDGEGDGGGGQDPETPQTAT